jgi:hypothetical protein
MTTSSSRRFRLLLVPAVLAAAVLAGSDRAAAQAGGCPSVGADPDSAGPFGVTVQRDAAHTYYSPTYLGTNGCARHPVILWSDGTVTSPAPSSSPSPHDPLLRHLASHGFVVAATTTSDAGGADMLAGLDNLTRFDGQAGNRFHGRIDLTRVGTSGHSQGGGAAMAAARDPRVDTTFPLAPRQGDPTGIVGSALYLAGHDDTVVTPNSVRDDYEGSGPIAAYAELADADHFTGLGDGGGFRAAATAWARWQLMGDTAARRLFAGAGCGLCSSGAWSAYQATGGDLRAAGAGANGGGDGADAPPAACVSATNAAHARAGRASGALLVFAAGSGDDLGFPVATTALRPSGPITWELIDSC